MNPLTLAKISAKTASEVCGNFDLRAEARPLLRQGQTPAEFLQALLDERKHAPAIDFLAHALPAREAIWWGCLCIQAAQSGSLSQPEGEALKAAARWVLDPTEANRAAAKPAGEAAGLKTPAGGLAMAAAWTGGSLAPPLATTNPKIPQPPPVSPGPFVPAKAVAGAVLLASTKGDPSRIRENQRGFVELGIGVGEGRFAWPEPRRQTAPKTERTWKLRETRA
jgi:hypothetical protein